jgi:hypothetical protein
VMTADHISKLSLLVKCSVDVESLVFDVQISIYFDILNVRSDLLISPDSIYYTPQWTTYGHTALRTRNMWLGGHIPNVCDTVARHIPEQYCFKYGIENPRR